MQKMLLLRGKTNRYWTPYIRRAKNLRVLGTVALSSLVLLFLLTIFPIYHKTESAEASYTPATTPTLVITSANPTASVNIKPVSSSGTFATSASADEAAFTVATDNLAGYKLDITGNDFANTLINTVTGETLESIAAVTDAGTFASGSSATYANKWGIKPSMYQSAINTSNYIPAPTTSASLTFYQTSAPNATGTSDSYTIGIGTRVDYTKSGGTYTKTFTLLAVANSFSYEINYIDSSSDHVSVPAQESESNITASDITLSATVPTRSGYAFKGWCYGSVNHSVDPSTCSADATTGAPGTVYQAGDSFTFANLSSATANLYAMWQNSAIYIQNMDPSLCVTSDATEVIDSRDGEHYKVQRLADGNCWLLDNLRLGASTLVETLSTDNTNMSPSKSFTLPESGGTSSATVARIDASVSDYVPDDTYGVGSNKAGVYYNVCAVSAGTKCSNGNSSIQYDVCPAGWRLPTGNTDGELNVLYSYYSPDYTAMKNALSLSNTGMGWYLAGGNRNSYGYWWSSTPGITTDTSGSNIYAMYGMSVSSSNVNSVWLHYGGGYQYGHTIRCIMKDTRTIQDIEKMQEVSQQIVANTTEGDTNDLIDTRDNQVYTVTKINGDLWMTENLALGCDGNYRRSDTLTLNKLNSNVTNDWTISTSNVKSLSSADGECTGGASGTCNTYTDPRMKCDAEVGAYYNYAAASAGTVATASNQNVATESICPKGWKLPINTKLNGIRTYVSEFTPVQKGFYNGGTITTSDPGHWWSATSGSATARYHLYYNGSTMATGNNGSRYSGYYVRCIAIQQ